MKAAEPESEIPREWLEEFESAARRPLKPRFRYSFIKTYKPVLDDVGFRAFDTMEDYRRWCEENLPDWLGYGRVFEYRPPQYGYSREYWLRNRSTMEIR